MTRTGRYHSRTQPDRAKRLDLIKRRHRAREAIAAVDDEQGAQIDALGEDLEEETP